MSRHTSIPCLRATLNHVLQDYTATYLAGLGGYRDGSICTKVVAGDCWMSLPAYQRIACALTQHHADTRLSDAMAGPGWRARQDRPADMHTYDIYTSASGSVPAATAVKAATPLLAIAAYAGEQHEAPVTFGYLGYDLATLVIAGLTIIAVRAADDAITAAA